MDYTTTNVLLTTNNNVGHQLTYYITDLKIIATASAKKTNTPVALKIVAKG